jgi:hypothetical protein
MGEGKRRNRKREGVKEKKRQIPRFARDDMNELGSG